MKKDKGATDWRAVARAYRTKLAAWGRTLDPAYDEGDLDAIERRHTKAGTSR